MSSQVLNRRTVTGLGIVLVTAIASLVVAPSLPEQVPIPWNEAGVPDGTTAKSLVLVGGPALVLGVVVLFEAIPRLDPLSENIASFKDAYDAVAVLTAAFLAYSYGIVLAWNLGYQFAIGQALAPAIAVLFVAIGFLLERAERNWFVGIRTPWTLSSDAVWRHTHDHAGTLFKLAGVVALGGLLYPSRFVYFIVVPAIAVSVFALVYSYVDYRRIERSDSA